MGRFGSQDDIAELEKYLEKLDIFRSSVKLGDYVHARHRKNNILEFVQCKSVITIMSSDWKDRTLLDAERYRIGFGQENHFQQFLPRMDVVLSSIALIMSLPCWVEINLDELAGFFNRNDVKKVFVNCAIKQVNYTVILNYCQYTLHALSTVPQALKSNFFFFLLFCIFG